MFTTNQPTFRPMTPQAEHKVYVRQAEQTSFAEAWNSVLARAGKTQQKTWSTQSGKSFCLFGKSRLFAVGGVFSLPGSVLLSKSSSVQNRQQEIGGIRREIGGIRREIGGISRKQLSACRSVCRVPAFFLARGVVCAFRRKFLPPAARYVCGCARMQLRRPRAPLLSLSWSKPAATRGLCQLVVSCVRTRQTVKKRLAQARRAFSWRARRDKDMVGRSQKNRGRSKNRLRTQCRGAESAPTPRLPGHA